MEAGSPIPFGPDRNDGAPVPVIDSGNLSQASVDLDHLDVGRIDPVQHFNDRTFVPAMGLDLPVAIDKNRDRSISWTPGKLDVGTGGARGANGYPNAWDSLEKLGRRHDELAVEVLPTPRRKNSSYLVVPA